MVTLDEMPLRERGPQGQQTLAVVALRMAQIDLYLREAGRQCVLLLDDIVGELDAQRRQELLTVRAAWARRRLLPRPRPAAS